MCEGPHLRNRCTEFVYRHIIILLKSASATRGDCVAFGLSLCSNAITVLSLSGSQCCVKNWSHGRCCHVTSLQPLWKSTVHTLLRNAGSIVVWSGQPVASRMLVGSNLISDFSPEITHSVFSTYVVLS